MNGSRRAVGLAIAVLLGTALFACGPKNPQVMNSTGEKAPMKSDSPIHVIAFTEQPAVKGQPILLHVHIVNESQTPLAIWSELDSINIPKNPPGDGIAPNTELTHIDFGASENGRFMTVGPTEAVKVTLILRDTQLAQLDRVKAVKVPVKVRTGDQGDAKIQLLQGKVYKTHSQAPS